MTTAPQRTAVDEHVAHVAALVGPAWEHAALRVDDVVLEHALGRITAEPTLAPLDLPPFRNSQMDGFALRAADARAGKTLPVVGVIAAAPGTVEPLHPGTAVRIMTGAAVPEGADVVVPVENATTTVTDAGETVTIGRAAESGAFVREAGADLPAGGELLGVGVRLASRHLAALAAAGLVTVVVRSRIRIAIITTGSELAQPGTTLQPGQIFDSNGPALAAAATSAGAEVVLLERVTDDGAEFARALAEATVLADCVITAGGISQGEFEVVREVLGPHGAWIGSVALQPGGPQATARFAGVPVVCFPGNPVSAQLSFELFLAPLLRTAAELPARQTESRRLSTNLTSIEGKVQLVRARALDDGLIEPVAGPGSHLVAALARSDRIIVVPSDTTRLAAGDDVQAWVL